MDSWSRQAGLWPERFFDMGVQGLSVSCFRRGVKRCRGLCVWQAVQRTEGTKRTKEQHQGGAVPGRSEGCTKVTIITLISVSGFQFWTDKHLFAMNGQLWTKRKVRAGQGRFNPVRPGLTKSPSRSHQSHQVRPNPSWLGPPEGGTPSARLCNLALTLASVTVRNRMD